MLAANNKPKVVVDTNVFVSGLNFKGKPREVLDLIWKGEIELYISPFILAELEKSLEEDFGWVKTEIQNTLSGIKAKATEVRPTVTVTLIKKKDDDNRILECALEAKAQYIISGDKRHLLPLREFERITILSPAQFLRLF